MCNSDVGVVKRIEVERISKEISDLVKALDKEIKKDDVNIPVKKVKHVKERLGKLIE